MSLTLLQALQDQALYPHPANQFELIETHISWVLLTGSFAYKIKKPENFGFLDFSTLEKRHHYCQEELRLNRRFAPKIYLEVVPIYGSEKAPSFRPKGAPFEYAVKMLQFPQDQLLDQLLLCGKLSNARIEELAHTVATFHQQIPSAEKQEKYGAPQQLIQPVLENFKQIIAFLQAPSDIAQLRRIEHWVQDQAKRLEPIFEQRKQQGNIRECHGDLHLGNITLFKDEITLFDCIEFNPSLRWIDVMSDVAFLTMDLQARDAPSLANHFLNAYLEITGDYEGLKVLNFYQCYRAMVRAKVALLSLSSKPITSTRSKAIFDQYNRYIQLAERYMIAPKRQLLLMHGFSGTGKTTVSTELVDQLGAIRLRSDVERKRIFQFKQQKASAIDGGIYSHSASDRTFDHLAATAHTILRAGYRVIVDATFLHKPYRDRFFQLAENLNITVQIISCELADKKIRRRLEHRQAIGTDPSDADTEVYEAQLKSADPLSEAELNHTHCINTAQKDKLQQIIEILKSL